MTDNTREGVQAGVSLRRRWGRWLERRDRCCHCARRIAGREGTHAFGFWFCHRHWNAKTMGPWSDA